VKLFPHRIEGLRQTEGHQNWKSVPGYEAAYMVSDAGLVFSCKSGRLLTLSLTTHGYIRVSLNTGHKSSVKHVHRLVAEAFIPNPDNLPQVNHKDGDRLNNNVSNLEWCNNSQNQQHAYDTGLKSKKLSAEDRQYICTHYIPRHHDYGTRGLGRKFGVSQTAICHVLKKGGGSHV